MKTRTQTRRLACLVLGLIATLGTGAAAQTSGVKATRQSDVIYGRKFGVALTMEVFTAATRNGIGVVWVVSSSGRSSREQTLQDSFERRIAPLLEHGYTVFAVIHGSAPIFNLQDQVSDVRRAVRFVRHRAAELGLMVASARLARAPIQRVQYALESGMVRCLAPWSGSFGLYEPSGTTRSVIL